MASDLTDLKNKVAFAFLMINAVFVILVFLLQLEKESIHINWPFGRQSNVTYQPLSTEVSTLKFEQFSRFNLYRNIV